MPSKIKPIARQALDVDSYREFIKLMAHRLNARDTDPFPLAHALESLVVKDADFIKVTQLELGTSSRSVDTVKVYSQLLEDQHNAPYLTFRFGRGLNVPIAAFREHRSGKWKKNDDLASLLFEDIDKHQHPFIDIILLFFTYFGGDCDFYTYPWGSHKNFLIQNRKSGHAWWITADTDITYRDYFRSLKPKFNHLAFT